MSKGKYLLPGLLWLSLAGCAPLIFFGVGTVAGVGGYKWSKGGLTVIFQAPYMEVWDATLNALRTMNIQIKNKKHDLTAGKIEANRADGKSVTVSLEYKSTKETEVTIRVGFLGDRSASEAIKEEIRKELFK